VFGRLPQNDVVLDHASISRQHAALCFRAKQPQQALQGVLMDLGSAHGTFVQGARLARVSADSSAAVVAGSSACGLRRYEAASSLINQTATGISQLVFSL